MTIRAKVARAIDPEAWGLWDQLGMEKMHCDISLDLADEIIPAFVAAVADEGWRIVPEEATQEMMGTAGKIVEGGEYILGVEVYPAMLAAAPKFEWDK